MRRARQADAAVHTLLSHSAGLAGPALCWLDAERIGGVWQAEFARLLAGWREQGHAARSAIAC